LIAVCAALGLTTIFSQIHKIKSVAKASKLIQSGLLLILFVFIITTAISVKQITLAARQNGSNYANLYKNPYLEFLANQAKISPGGPFRVGVLFDDQRPITASGFLWPYGINTIGGYTRLYTHRFSTFWLAILQPMYEKYPGCRIVHKHLAGTNRVELSNGCSLEEAVDIRDASELFDLKLLSLANTKFLVSVTPITDKKLAPIDTSHISCGAIPGCTQYYIYELDQAFPVVFALSNFVLEEGEDAVLTRVSEETFDFLSQNAVLDKASISVVQTDSGSNTAEAIEVAVDQYSGGEVTVTFSSDSPHILVYNTAYTPFWFARVDGKLQATLPVDYLFVGTQVPAGTHQVTFFYDPPYTPDGMLTKLLTKIADKLP
jgi:hypothetical protein